MSSMSRVRSVTYLLRLHMARAAGAERSKQSISATTLEKHEIWWEAGEMDIDHIAHPLRLAKESHQPGSGKGSAMNVIGKVLVGAVGAVISVGLAAPAGAAVPDFLAAVRAAGITGTDPAMLEDGYSVCRRLWVRQMAGTEVAAGLVQDHPQLTRDQADQFVLAAYHGLCPVPGGFDGGTWDYWAYSTGGNGGGGGGG